VESTAAEAERLALRLALAAERVAEAARRLDGPDTGWWEGAAAQRYARRVAEQRAALRRSAEQLEGLAAQSAALARRGRAWWDDPGRAA
jgi:hypothetical protein